MIIPSSGNSLLINTRGRVVEVPAYDVEAKRAEGYRIVVNPQRSYYAEFDVSAGGEPATDNIIENLSTEDILPGEEL